MNLTVWCFMGKFLVFLSIVLCVMLVELFKLVTVLLIGVVAFGVL